MKDKIDFNGYFYNPNIHPSWEYRRRKQTLQQLAEQFSIPIHYSDPVEDLGQLNALSFENKWNSFRPDERCRNCYRIRLEQTARFAVDHKFDAFSTTLMGSIYQNHALLCEIGSEVSVRFNIEFYNRDFREGFRIGQNLAREQGLYRQKFCGCICSLNQSALKSKIYASTPTDSEFSPKGI
jgi:predicted adenine nucleotide alpha hydrolase (AANH) superfamily ATPase